MPKKKIKQDYAPHIDEDKAPRCEVKGCKESGVYKAPKSRSQLNKYQWFCLEHIRDHNAHWDFFADMSRSQIEAFMKDAVTGHRPTWERTAQVERQYEKLQHAIDDFLYSTGHKPAPKGLTPKLRSALAMMDMEYPYTVKMLKSQYRRLVKKYHPDANKGDKKAEDKFKEITSAYATLMHYAENL